METITILQLGQILFSFWLIAILLLPLIAGIFKSNKSGWGNFWGIWGFFVIITLGILIYYLTMPEVVINLLEKIVSLFTQKGGII